MYEELIEIGYCCLTIESEKDLIELACKLGKIQYSRKNSSQYIDLLTVNQKATQRGLSSKYKDGEFPFHTDGAYLLTPPNYVVLRCEQEINSCPTILSLIDLNDNDLLTLKRDVWLVNGGRGKFYSSILSNTNNKNIIRYDEDCMRPITSIRSKDLIHRLISDSKKVEINWRRNLTVVIDNWRILHKRSDAKNSEERVLQRIWST